MKAILILATILLAAQGCQPVRQAPVTPTPATEPPPAAPAASAPSSDERALQTLRDLGVTPEIMLQLVRNQLAAAAKPDALDQPVPEPIAEPTPPATPLPATPAPVVQTPAPTVPPPAPEAQETEPVVSTPPPPAAEWPNTSNPEQPAVVASANTVMLRQPVIIQQTQDFYTPLNAYGDWITIPTYGRVWQPAVTMVSSEWRPYCNGGRWVYTDCGWYWQSDYSWGWAVFHYGRWCYVDRHRWVWIPDTVWAPAWVSWRRSETHCGWAPLPPGTTFRVGVGFTIGHGAQFDVQVGLSSRHYTFVANSRLAEQNLNSVIVRKEEVETVYQRSSHVDNSHDWNEKHRRVHNKGPDRDEEARARQTSARTIHFVPTPAAPGKKHAAKDAPVVAPPVSIAPAAPALPVVAPAAPSLPVVAPAAPSLPVVAPATPVTPTTPGTPPSTTPDRHTPKPTPTPAVPVKWRTPETPKNEKRSTPAVDREAAVDPAPVMRLPDNRHRDAPAIVLPRKEPPSIPVTTPVIPPQPPITSLQVRRDEVTIAPQHTRKESKPDRSAASETKPVSVPLPEPKAEPVNMRDAKVESVPARTTKTDPVAVKELPVEKSSDPGSSDKARSDKTRTDKTRPDDEDDTTTSHRRGGFPSSRP